MSDWKSKWQPHKSDKYTKIYWWNIETRNTNWLDPNGFNTEEEYINSAVEVNLCTQEDLLYTFEKNQVIECSHCNRRLIILCKSHIAYCTICKKTMKASDYISSLKLDSEIKNIKEQNKKRKLNNEELKTCRENSKKVIDKLNEENKRLKTQVSDLEKLLNTERNINKRIKETELFETWKYMDEIQRSNSDIFVRKDGLPSKNNIVI